MIHAVFCMEQHIGHRTYYQNLRGFVDADSQVRSTWIEITYMEKDSLWGRLPLLPAGIRGTLIGRKQVRRGLDQAAGDIALFNTQVPAALAGRLVRRQPYIICTDITPIQYDRMGARYGHKSDRNRLLRLYKNQINLRLFQRAARLLPWSTWAASSLLNDYGVVPERVEILSPGVDVDKWRPATRPNLGPMRVLFIGGDFYRKGGEMLLRAFRQLPDEKAELVVVTHSPLPQEKGVTVFNDMQPNSPELIALCQSCDLFVLPTEAEAFGIAAVEASAAGLPVIGTNVGGLEDIVSDGETGFLIPSGNVKSLADRMCTLLFDADLRKRMGQAARIRAVDRFSARKNAARMMQIIKEITFSSDILLPQLTPR